MKALVGNTGFVGSNLCVSGQFDAVYHSTDIEKAYGTQPDLLIYAGIRAEKFIANSEPELDLERIHQAEFNIERIKPRKLVLISTVDVFPSPVGVDEHSMPDLTAPQAYGRNRALLEQWVRSHFPDALIVRLPALFGNGLKKNFLYDMIHLIPTMLRKEKLLELSEKDPEIRRFFIPCPNGFFKLDVPDNCRAELGKRFEALDFTALRFTDSRSQFQFYSLFRLWEDLQTALAHDLTFWHPATEPVTASEIYHYCTGKTFHNEITQTPALYDYRTAYAELFGGCNGYIDSKAHILQQVRWFYHHERLSEILD